MDNIDASRSRALDTGPTVEGRIECSRRALMPFVALLAVFPLGLVLRRNVRDRLRFLAPRAVAQPG